MVAEVRKHSVSCLHVGLPAHLITAEFCRYLIVKDRGEHAHGEEVGLMAGEPSRASFTGPEGVNETELLARIEDLTRSFVHWAEDFGCLVDGHEITLTSVLMSG